MAKCTQLSFNQGELNSKLAAFFGSLLENKAVDAVLVPMKQGANGVMQTLVTDPAMLSDIDPFAPVVPLNSAKMISSLTAQPSGKKIAVVARSCEIRAAVELAKLKQVTVDDNLLLIGMDCLGRYENTDFKIFQAEDGTSESFLSKALGGDTKHGSFDVTEACKICEFPTAANCDLQLGAIGNSGAISVEATSDKGLDALSTAGAAMAESASGREAAIEALAKSRAEARDAKFAAFRETTDSFEGLAEKIAGCINCYNCRVACPVCYCKECVFVTDTFRHKGEQFFNWANNKGQIKMPTDTMMYHLTRMTHMSTFCVGCGQCTSACPNDIDLMPLFRTTAEKTQARFDYEAGRSLDEAQPLSIFESDEMVEVTGQVK